MIITETDRLRLRWATRDDAAFIFKLVTEPAWGEHIGKSKVATIEQAAGYIERALIAMYEEAGFGLYLVELKQTGEALGICGLIRRETLEDVDLGFALLEEHWGKGYAFEAGRATLDVARMQFDLKRVVAITSLTNQPSIALLEKLGFNFEKKIQFNPDDAELMLFGVEL
ncbi:MAG: RimJ/RimL family protein N-acetyltransferase [Planctomycetota bacterium]|jgi:RimJ/RimL family protein N-acetyltransferase